MASQHLTLRCAVLRLQDFEFGPASARASSRRLGALSHAVYGSSVALRTGAMAGTLFGTLVIVGREGGHELSLAPTLVAPCGPPRRSRRDHSCDIRIVNKEISRKHAEVFVEDTGAVRRWPPASQRGSEGWPRQPAWAGVSAPC